MKRTHVFFLLALVALGSGGWFAWSKFRTKTYHLTFYSGDAAGLRHRLGKNLAAEVSKQSIHLEIKDLSSSEQALEQVNEGKVDLAFVQGCIDLSKYPNLREVTPLHFEPIHLLVKREHAEAVRGSLTALRGKTVNVSKRGSSTFSVVTELLEFVGLRSGDYTMNTLGVGDLLKETNRDKLPDAVFLVSLLPSPLAKQLVTRYDFCVMPLHFRKAIALYAILEEGPAEEAESQQSTDARASSSNESGKLPLRIHKGSLFQTSIPAFAYSVDPPQPPQDTETIGTRLLLVANRNVPDDAVERLLGAIYGSRFSQLAEQTLTDDVLKQSPEIDWHPGTLAYKDSLKPVNGAEVAGYISSIVCILFTLGGFLYSAAQLVMAQKREAKKNLVNYLKTSADLEQQVQQMERDPQRTPSRLIDLRLRLTDLKTEVMQQLADGALEQTEFLAGFMIHIGSVITKVDDLIDRAEARQPEPKADRVLVPLGSPDSPASGNGAP